MNGVFSGAQILLVGNKLDLATQKPLNYIGAVEAENVASDLGAYGALQCSGLQEVQGGFGNVDRVFELAIRVALENQRIPEPEPNKCFGSCNLL